MLAVQHSEAPSSSTVPSSPPAQSSATAHSSHSVADSPPSSEEQAVEEAQEMQQAEDKVAETRLQKILHLLDEQFFVLGILLAVCIAAAYPPLGRSGGPLMPSLTTGILAVAIIFFTSGLTLRSSELRDAAIYVKFNVCMQFYIFVFFPAVTFGVANILLSANYNRVLAHGLIIMSCVPTSIGMTVVLNKSAGGNDAVAVFNSTVANILGIFLTPLLLLLLLSGESSVAIQDTILSLVYKVIVPLCAGQIIRYLPVPAISEALTKHRKALRRVPELMLMCIIYTTFCDTFYNGTDTSAGQLVLLIFVVLVLLGFFSAVLWWGSTLPCLNFDPPNRVSAVYIGASKTASLGIPLINTIYAGSPNLGLYSVPLLMYYPCQVLIGSFLSTPLRKWVARQQEEETKMEDSGDELDA